jgi:hypothetical protein
MISWVFYHYATVTVPLSTNFIQLTIYLIITIQMKGARECSGNFKDQLRILTFCHFVSFCSSHGRIWKRYLAMMRWVFYHCASTASSLNTDFTLSTFCIIFAIQTNQVRDCSGYFKIWLWIPTFLPLSHTVPGSVVGLKPLNLRWLVECFTTMLL